MFEVVRQTTSVSLTAMTLQTDKTTRSLSPELQRSQEEAERANQLRRDMAAARKANARAMVDRLKEQIGKLSVMAIINPKAMARLLATMSRQLATAAAEYSRDGNSRDIEADAKAVADTAAAMKQQASGEQATLSVTVLTVDISQVSVTASDNEIGDAIDKDLAAVGEDADENGAVLAEASRTTISLAMASIEAGSTAVPQGKLKAYIDPERQADEHFGRTVKELRKVLEILFETAIGQAQRQRGQGEDEREAMNRLIRDFGATNAQIRKAEKTIADWWANQPSVELAPAVPTDVTA